MNCPLCDLENVKSENTGDFSILVKCGRCGSYKTNLDGRNASQYYNEIKNDLYLISAITRQATENGQLPMRISSELLADKKKFYEKIAESGSLPSSVEDKGNAILQYLAKKSEHPGSVIEIIPAYDFPIGYCKNETEFSFYLSHLKDGGLLAEFKDIAYVDHKAVRISLGAAGWKRVSALAAPNAESKQAFVAMSFAKGFNSTFLEGIAPVEKPSGYIMLRMDGRQFNGKICDEIILEIRRSRFVVAEVSGQNRGVYYEAGFAMGMGIPVIWCCRENAIAKCHFDTRQFNHIVWKDPPDLKTKLTNRILATIVRPNVTTSR